MAEPFRIRTFAIILCPIFSTSPHPFLPILGSFCSKNACLSIPSIFTQIGCLIWPKIRPEPDQVMLKILRPLVPFPITRRSFRAHQHKNGSFPHKYSSLQGRRQRWWLSVGGWMDAVGESWLGALVLGRAGRGEGRCLPALFFPPNSPHLFARHPFRPTIWCSSRPHFPPQHSVGCSGRKHFLHSFFNSTDGKFGPIQ